MQAAPKLHPPSPTSSVSSPNLTPPAPSLPPVQIFIALSCLVAVGVNLSQFICIGRFTAVSFQVLGHMKTVLVLVLGFTFFGKEGLGPQVRQRRYLIVPLLPP